MTDEGVWRDEERLPLADLAEAMATSSLDGQADDATGSDAGAEGEFGHDAVAGGRPAARDGDPDPTSAEGRSVRPSTTGRTGPDAL